MGPKLHSELTREAPANSGTDREFWEGTGDLGVRRQSCWAAPCALAATRRLSPLHAAPGLSLKFASVWIKLWLGRAVGWRGGGMPGASLLSVRDGSSAFPVPSDSPISAPQALRDRHRWLALTSAPQLNGVNRFLRHGQLPSRG